MQPLVTFFVLFCLMMFSQVGIAETTSENKPDGVKASDTVVPEAKTDQADSGTAESEAADDGAIEVEITKAAMNEFVAACTELAEKQEVQAEEQGEWIDYCVGDTIRTELDKFMKANEDKGLTVVTLETEEEAAAAQVAE